MSQKWIDQTVIEKQKSRTYRSIAIVLGMLCLVLACAVTVTSYFYFANIDNKTSSIIALPPPESGAPIEFSPGSMVSDKYIVRVAQSLVECVSNFTWQTIEDRIKRRCAAFFSETMLNRYEANLLTSNFIAEAKEKKMVRSFVVQNESLKGGWCKEIASACATICGKLFTYVSGNQPYSERKICYFVLSKFSYPTKENPFVVRVSRFVLFDKENPQELASKFLADAQKGIYSGVAH